jgi:hypothetical protein
MIRNHLIGSLCLVFLAAPAQAALFITNFTALDGTSGASGVWRNNDTATDTAIPVTLTQTGGEVRPEGAAGGSTPSTIDDSFPWQDPPVPPAPAPGNWFEPNFSGDHINIAVNPGNTSNVMINFTQPVVDPVLSFSDVDTQTMLVFTDPFTVIGEAPNLVSTPTSVTTSGGFVIGIEQETLGSLKFSGTYSSLAFQIVNDPQAQVPGVDRTGFVVSTEMIIPEPSVGLLLAGGLLMLRRRR